MLKILVISDASPHIPKIASVIFRQIIQSMKFELEIFWLVTDDFAEIKEDSNMQCKMLLLSDFNNSLELIDKIKPDLIYHSVGNNIVDYSFILAEKLLNIPSFGYADSANADYFTNDMSLHFRVRLFKEYVRQFFERKRVGKNNQIKKMRGINFLKKYLFLIKSFQAIKKSRIKIISELLSLIKIGNISSSNQFNAKFNCDLIFVENPRDLEYHVKTGLIRENMVIVGNPLYDSIFEKQTQYLDTSSKNLKILFLTVNLSGGQGKSDWSISKRNQMIKELTENVDENITLTVKIHPIAENYLQYEKLLKPCKNIHLSQNEDILELISKSDIILTSCTSTAGIIALIMKKPVVVWNYFNVEQDLFLKKKIVIECKKSSELMNCLLSAESFRGKNEKRIQEVIEEKFIDGKSMPKIIKEFEKFIKKIGVD